jgi:hypothetical protein
MSASNPQAKVVNFSDLDEEQKEKYLQFLSKREIAFEKKKDDDFVATIRIQPKPLKDCSNQQQNLSQSKKDNDQCRGCSINA